MKMRRYTKILMWMAIMLKVEAQQSYVNNHQLDCYNHYNATDGFICNGATSSCLSFLTFRPISPYDSPVSIAYLLASDAASIASANNISDVYPVPSDRPLLVVPVNCSCSAGFYRHNATYLLKSAGETYFSVANNTYQGLTTCQALMASNPSIGYRNLSRGLTLHVPLFCACPTPRQAASGVRYLLSYLVSWRDEVSSIARRFRLDDPQPVLDANRLSYTDVIYPFTPILVPLAAPPQSNWLLLQDNSPSPTSLPPPPAAAAAPPPNSSSKKLAIIVGAGAGASLLLLLAAAFLFLFLRRRRSLSLSNGDGPFSSATATAATALPPPDMDSPSSYSPLPGTDSRSLSSQGIQSAMESLTLYAIEDLQAATNFFAQANKIRGSVYRGSFKGDTAAVKVMKGDVVAEINILKGVNHSNIVRLSGFCAHAGNTYLVYEYAETGSLSDCLHHNNDKQLLLGWKQRVEIAHDMADALNYLHNFADPPCIHKNLKSSNVLLDANLRAKLSNFGLARSLQNHPDHQGGRLHLTRHVVGTQGYLAPEYVENGLITPKVDVFAFGVVLLELLSGREAAVAAATKKKNGREELLCDSIKQVLEGDNVKDKLRGFVDPTLRQEYPLDMVFSMAQLANACIAPDFNSRPDISQVFLTLSKIRSSSCDWDPSDELNGSISFTHDR